MRELVFASFLAPNIRPVYELVASRVGKSLGQPSRLVDGETFDQLLDGSVDFAFICGLPYVRLSGHMTAIAAPVVEGERYGDRPIYYSDVIVPRDSHARSFRDLRGASWAYNEPDSHSGYLITLHTLLRMGETPSYFGRWEMTGFHEESIRRVAAGTIDASAIDSQVLAVALRDHPELHERVRVIDVLGPSTIQPLVVGSHVDEHLRDAVRTVVITVDDPGLAEGLVRRFVPVDDSAYDDIRTVLRAVTEAGFTYARSAG